MTSLCRCDHDGTIHPLTIPKLDAQFISSHSCCRLGLIKETPSTLHTDKYITATGIGSITLSNAVASLCSQRHSAVSLRNITTEVLKVVNATEELLHGVEGASPLPTTTLPPNTDPKKLDQQFTKLEENVQLSPLDAVDF